MLPYVSRKFIKYIKGLLVFCLLFSIYFSVKVSTGPDIAVVRYPPQSVPNYKCPHNALCNSSSYCDNDNIIPSSIISNLTESRVLILLESAYSRHGRLLLQILNASKFPHKAEPLAKNLPLLTTAIHGRYSVIIIENYYKYLNMAKWNRQLLDKYCKDYSVPIVAFMTTRPNDTFERAKIKGTTLGFWQNQVVDSLRVEKSQVNFIAKEGAQLSDIQTPEWVLFEDNNIYKAVLSARDSLGRRRAAVVHDIGKQDGIQRVLFGHNVTDWLIKTTFLDALWYTSGRQFGWGLDRYIQVDIDDIFVGSRGTRVVESDVDEILASQDRLRNQIHNFTYCLGFSGSYFRNGDDNEDRGDEYLIEKASNFIWFPHMWRHNHAHEHNYTYMEASMTQNRLFAKSMHLPVPYPYAIAPQHDGIYPVHAELYEAWKKVWRVEVTTTEEYPHFKPASERRGFIHKEISVLPRQTCGLYTHTQFFHSYPDGFSKLVSLIQGGDLFFTILLNPISVFMTHQQNFAHDRLAVYTFENLVRFLRCWTNLRLKWQDPVTSARMYFTLFPKERTPVWNNPCSDPRHRSILPPSLNCTNMTLPHVLLVGPQKTGSTALASFLSLHPNTSTNKPISGSWEELQFFGGANYHEGIDWYVKRFTPAQCVFEKSATYMDNPNAAAQAAALLPSAKIVVILFDPSKRAYSWYQHLLAHNDTTAIAAGSMEGILDGTTPAMKKTKQRCISGGRYTHHLDRWLENFPMSQLVLVDGERLKTEPVKVMVELTEKLGLPWFDYEKTIRFSPSKGYFCQLIDGKTRCLGRSKGRPYPAMSTSLSNRLNRLFLPDNMALHKFLLKNKLTVPTWLPQLLEVEQTNN